MSSDNNIKKDVNPKIHSIEQNVAKYCDEWNKSNEEIEKCILTLPLQEALPIILPQIEQWKKKMYSKWSYSGLSCEDAFNDTLYFMYVKGFDDFKKKKEEGVDIYIYPYFLKKMKSLCYKQRRERFGFRSDHDYDTYLKMKRICEVYGVKLCVDNAYLFSIFIGVSNACIVRVLESFKNVSSFEEMQENKYLRKE